MSALDAKALYQALVLEHGRSTRNEGPLTGATHAATATNRLCGDRVTIRVRVSAGAFDPGRARVPDAIDPIRARVRDSIEAVRFEARGCLLARASASLLVDVVTGQSLERSAEWTQRVEALVSDAELTFDLGALEALRPVRDFPARRACVALAWRALSAALRAPLAPET